jgi:hypothetical protein
MIHLHPPDCACGDCRNRRLIRGIDAAEVQLKEEPRRLSPLPGREDAGRKSWPPGASTGRRVTPFWQL